MSAQHSDRPPYPKRGDPTRIVHEASEKDFSLMKCGLLRRSILYSALDAKKGYLPTCLWCVNGRY